MGLSNFIVFSTIMNKNMSLKHYLFTLQLASLLETVAKEYADLKLLLDKVQDELGLDVVETMKEIKLAADYAKKMRPRADLYEKALINR